MKRQLLAFAVVAAVLGARAEDLAINVAADQTATYDQDATVTSVTLGSRAIASLMGVHTYTLKATALTLGSDSVFNVADGATLVMSGRRDSLFTGLGGWSISNATVTTSAIALIRPRGLLRRRSFS